MDTEMNNHKLDKDIEIAFKSRGLNESMKQWDMEIKDKKQYPLVIRLAISVSAAAVLIGFFFIPFGWQSRVIGEKYINDNIDRYQSYIDYRGGEETEYVADAYENLCMKNYREAALSSGKAIQMLAGAKDDDKIDLLQDAEWYNALANLSRGQLFHTLKAKHDLNRIAKENGKHKEEAKELLKTLE